jgi:recyclin-1
MEKFETLKPVKLYGSASKPIGKAGKQSPVQFIGRLPIDLHLTVLAHLPIPDIPTYARCSRSLLNLSRHETVWETKWNAFRFDRYPHLSKLLDQLEDAKKIKEGGHLKSRPPIIPVEAVDDGFGEFAQVQTGTSQLVGEHNQKDTLFAAVSSMGKPTYLSMYIRAHKLLKPYTTALLSPHSVLPSLFPSPPGSEPVPLLSQSRTLHLLLLWLSPSIKPLRNWQILCASLRSAVDKYEANLLGTFDVADSRSDEIAMREIAEASWEVWQGDGEWELGRVWADKREIFYETEKWKPMDNFTCVIFLACYQCMLTFCMHNSQKGTLEFDAMDEFIKHVLSALKEHGSRAVRVFPADSKVLLSFADRLAVDVVADYINQLLSRAREISNEAFLIATAASFKEAWRMVDVIMQVASSSSSTTVIRADAEGVV